MLCLITCFHGRHNCVERIIRCFLNQDYRENITLLLYNNSKIEQFLDRIPLPVNKHIKLVNNHLNLLTGEEYTNVGDIFRDALTFVPENTKVVSFFDSDDLFLPNHALEGVLGWEAAMNKGMLAYKPYKSYYLYGENKVSLEVNNMEPSVFCSLDYIKEMGFYPKAASYHQAWLTPLQKNKTIFESVDGVPTLIYNWANGHSNYKISGLGDSDSNFYAHREYETDFGDNVLSACEEKIVNNYYELIYDWNIQNNKS